MHRFIKSLFGQRASRSAVQSKRSFQPGLENLENRWNPSCVVTTADAGHTLIILGDNGANNVSIEQNDNANTLKVICDGAPPQFFSSTAITKIKVDLKGDNDDLWYGLADGTNFKHGKQADLKMGEGDDTVVIDMWQGIGVPNWISSNLIINLDAGAGLDDVDADFGGKRGGELKFQAKMQGGDDVCHARQWGDIASGAKVTFDLQAGAGNDTIGSWDTYDNAVPGYGSIDVLTGCSFTIKMNGGSGEDELYLTYSGKVLGQLNILLEGGADNDLLSATKDNNAGIYLQPGSTGVLNAFFKGDAGDDEIEMEVWDYSAGAAWVNAVSDGGLGYDHSSHTTNVSGINSEWYTTVL